MKNQPVVDQGIGEVLHSEHPLGPHGYCVVLLDAEGTRIALQPSTA